MNAKLSTDKRGRKEKLQGILLCQKISQIEKKSDWIFIIFGQTQYIFLFTQED